MPSAFPYIRFSSARQTTGSSAERQRQMVTQWLTQHPDYTLSNLTYEDLGRSGYHGEHLNDDSGFAKLLQAVEAGSIKAGDVVLVEAIDRAGRLSPMQMLKRVIIPIIEAGVSIITLDDNVKYDSTSVDGGHLFLLVAKIQAAHGYSKALSERTKASYAIRHEKAKATGKVKRHTPMWLDSEGKLKEQVAPYIKQAFELYVSGVGKTAIANRLRASGVPELATCSGPTVEGWLRNQTAIGCWEYGKEDPDKSTQVVRGVYPPVVSDELYMQAQQRKKAAATKPRERTSKHFLVGLVKCGVCGANYIIHHKSGKPNNMRCGTHHRLKSKGCINSETIPYQVVMHIYSLTSPDWIDTALKVIKLSANDKRKLALNKERDEITTSIQRLVKMLAKVDSPEIEVELEAATERRTAIDEELSVLERDNVKDESDAVMVGYSTALEQDLLTIQDPIQLSALLRQAGYSITVQVGHTLSASAYEPLVYAGILRRGNKTLGYRIQDSEDEWVISPIIPETPTIHNYSGNPSDQINYMMERSVKYVRGPMPIENNQQ
ncbi:recombinase family protein [Pseudomonas qingdaonensis]|uniref:recombinase family protein n=1 Tax=Pseudomonas qingdaonensis TaxID=2056231 RepID=UPI0035187A60